MIGLLRLGFDDGITADGLAEVLRQHSNDVASDVENLATVLEGFLRAIPDALACALAISKDRHSGRAVAFATGSILTYLFDEEDLLPEASFGTLGLLDDAYLVHEFVAMLRQSYPYVEPAVTYAAPDRHAFEVVASLLPEGVAESLRRTSESTIQVAQALFPATQGTGTADPGFRPEIRVGEAVQATIGAAART